MDFTNILYDDEELEELSFVLHGIPKRTIDRFDHFNSMESDMFRQRYRVSKESAIFILQRIESDLEYPYEYNNSVSPINQLLVFLRICATGSHLSLVADFSGMHISTVSRIIKRVAVAIASLYRTFIRMPALQRERDAVALKFHEKARFPRVIGAIDCTHIKIQSPGGNDAEIFRNRKGFFSINVQMVADPDLKICNIVARWPGSCHDSTIFNNSSLKSEFEKNSFPNSVLLGDSGYFLRPYLMTPVGSPQTQAEHLYNEAHIRTRNIIERLFGVLKRRFPILAYGSRLKIQTTLTVIVACGVLHNICRAQNEEFPPDPEDLALFNQVMQEDQVPEIPLASSDPTTSAMGISTREEIITYFNSLQE